MAPLKVYKVNKIQGSAHSITTWYNAFFIVGRDEETLNQTHYYPFYGIPSTIAINMIMSAASGGLLAVVIAVWAQVCSCTFL